VAENQATQDTVPPFPEPRDKDGFPLNPNSGSPEEQLKRLTQVQPVHFLSNATNARLYTYWCKPSAENPLTAKGDVQELKPWDPAADQREAERRRRGGNNLGIMVEGPIAGGPAAAARLAGAPEPVVEAAGEMGLNLTAAAALRGVGGRGRVIEPVRPEPVPTRIEPVTPRSNTGVVVLKRSYGEKDFISEHSYNRHRYDPDNPSTKNKTRYADGVDPNKIRQETIENPDKVEKLYDDNGNNYATRYSKDMGYNISQPPTNSSQSRVIINHSDPSQSTQFPYAR